MVDLWCCWNTVLGALFYGSCGVAVATRVSQFSVFYGWMIAGVWIGWGRWRILPNDAQLSLDHTKETLMNRRGAYDVGIESWELMWHQKNGVVRVLHDFTDREMAQDVLQEITNLDSPI